MIELRMGHIISIRWKLWHCAKHIRLYFTDNKEFSNYCMLLSHRLPRRWTGWFVWRVSWRQTLWPWREWRSTQKHRPRSVRFLRKNLFSWKNSSHLTELQTSCQLECEILSILGAREMNYVDDKSWFVNKYPTIVEPQSSVKYYITNFIPGGGWGERDEVSNIIGTGTGLFHACVSLYVQIAAAVIPSWVTVIAG